MVTISRSATTTAIYYEGQFKNLNTKTSLKLKINLIRPYHEVHTYSIKIKINNTKIS
jgi:hypothetical protein